MAGRLCAVVNGLRRMLTAGPSTRGRHKGQSGKSEGSNTFHHEISPKYEHRSYLVRHGNPAVNKNMNIVQFRRQQIDLRITKPILKQPLSHLPVLYAVYWSDAPTPYNPIRQHADTLDL